MKLIYPHEFEALKENIEYGFGYYSGNVYSMMPGAPDFDECVMRNPEGMGPDDLMHELFQIVYKSREKFR